jgi:hypothetical protein
VQLADALVSRSRDRYTERQVQQQIILDVRQVLTSIDLANASIESATLTRDLAQKNVEAEQQKYELGTITAFEVLDSQNAPRDRGEFAAECVRGISGGLCQLSAGHVDAARRVGYRTGDAEGKLEVGRQNVRFRGKPRDRPSKTGHSELHSLFNLP